MEMRIETNDAMTARRKENGIYIFGGTSEGRELAELILDKWNHALPLLKSTEKLIQKPRLCIYTASPYGSSLLPKDCHLDVFAGRLSRGDIQELCRDRPPFILIDATHPYACDISNNLQHAASIFQIPYLRIIRDGSERSLNGGSSFGKHPSASVSSENKIRFFNSLCDIASFLKGTSGNILITTGSKELRPFISIPDYSSRCFIRALPTIETIDYCMQLGFKQSHLLLMQGPFSEEMNAAILRKTGARYLVSKDSGKRGGFFEKVRAARKLSVEMLILKRPAEAASLSECICEGPDEALEKLLPYLYDF